MSEQMIFLVRGATMETAQPDREIPDFVVSDVAEEAEYSDQRIVVTLIDPQGRHLRLHLTLATGELLCERFADALENRYGP
jgi:hypothetical protein